MLRLEFDRLWDLLRKRCPTSCAALPCPSRRPASSTLPCPARRVALPCPSRLPANRDPGIEAATLGASESALSCTMPAEALHTFTLDSGASRCVRVRSGSSPLFVSPPVAPDSPLAPPPRSPLPATTSWHALPPPCFSSSHVSASPPALACPALPSLRRGVAVSRSSLLLVSPDNCSPAYSPHGLRLQLRERFREDLPVLRQHSDRGGELSSDLLRDFCRGEGILQSFTLPASPQENGVAERRIGLVMEVARTSMLYAAAPHFLWLFAVRFSVDPLPPQGSSPSGVSQVEPLPLAELVEVAVDSSAARGAASWGAEPAGAEPGGVEPERAELESAEPGGVGSEVAERGGAEPESEEPGGAEPEGAEAGGAEPRGTASAGGPAGASRPQSRQREPLSPRQLREWFAQRTRLRSSAARHGGPAAGGTGAGGTGAGGARAASLGGAGVTAGAGGTGAAGAAGPGGARTRGNGAARAGGVKGAGGGDPGAGGTGAGGAGPGGTVAGDPGGGGAGARGTRAGDPGAGGTRAEDPRAGGAGAGDAGAGGAGAGDPRAGGAGAGGAGAGDPGARGAGAGGAGGTVQRRPFLVPPPPSSLLPTGSGRPVAFDTWHDDLQLYLLSDSWDSVSLFDLVSGAAPAPPATADVSTRSQWLSRDATARLAIRNHLPTTECAHFGEHRTAQALYDAVVARYSSPATAALGKLLLPYLYPELSVFAIVADLVTHLRTSNARYRAAVPAEDHFLTLDPTSLTVDLLEQHLLAAETSAVVVGAARGTPRSPFFEGCSPSPLSSSSSAAAADVSVPEDVGAASTSTKCRNSKGKGGRGSGGGSGGGGGGSGRGSGGSGRGGGGGGGGGSGGGGGGSRGGGGNGGGGTSGSRSGPQRGGPGGGRGQQQKRRRKTQTPQQLNKWFHTEHCCFSRLDDAWRTEFGDDVERPRWAELLRSGVAIFDLDFDVIISAMYALFFSAEGDCYWCVPPDPSIAAAALGASVSGTPPGTVPAEALHTFTLDFGASRCFFRDSTTLTPLPVPVPVRLADPSGGPVVASSSTVLPCPAVPSGSLSGLHLPSFSTNLVSTAALQDAMVTTTTPGGSSLYTLATEPPQVAASAQVSASGQVAASCSCRLLSLPLLPPSPAPPCLPCVEGRQRAAPHSSSFPPTTAPLQTLHMDVWGPARVSGQGRERYFLLVVDDYMRHTTVFPLRSKGEVSAVLIPCIRTVRLQLRARFGQDLPFLRLHLDGGGEFSSDLLQDFCRGEGISQSFTLTDSPQQNGIAERRIGLVMEVAPQPLVRVSLLETSPTLRWTGKVGDASVFRVWGSRAFVRDTSADKLSAHAIPCVFLGFVPDAPGWQFYHPTSRRVLPSQDVTFDESVPFYRLFPYRSAPSPPPPLFLAPGPPPVDPLPPSRPAPSGVSQVDPLPGTAPVQVAVVSGAALGAASGGAASGGAEPGGAGSEGAGSGGAEPEGAEPEGDESEGAESGGAEPRGAALSGGPAGASPRLSSQQLREWHVQRAHRRSGAPGAGAPRGAGAGDAAVTTGNGDPTKPNAAGAGGAGAGVAGVGGPGAGGARGAGAGAVDPGTGGAGGTERPRPYFDPLLEHILGVPSSTGLPPPFLCPPPDQSQPPLQPASPLPVPSPYTEQFGGLTERREPASRLVSPVLTARCAPRSRPPLVPGTHTMALHPSSVPLRVPLPTPPESSLPEVPDPESDRARAASPTVARLLATAVNDPSFEFVAASALVAELLDFAAASNLDYASALVVEFVPASPPSVGGECALGTDVLEDRQEDFECLAAAVPRFASLLLAPEGDPDAPDIPTPRFYAEAITGPYSSQWQAAMDAEMASWKSTGTYVDEVPPLGVNIVDGMWIFRVKRPPGSPPAFKARYAARGFSQRQGVDYFQTFSPTPKMTTLRVLLHVAAQRDYKLYSLDFSRAFLQGSLHKEIWLRRPPGFTGSFPTGTQWSLRRPVYGLRQAPREWHDTLRTTLAALGFVPSTADPSLFLRTDTSLPPFYVLVYVDDLVFATADTEALTIVKSELQKRHTCTDLGELRSYLCLQITWDRAQCTITLTQSHMVHQVLQRFGFQYSLPQLNPLSSSHSLSAPPSGPYPKLVGCLMYLMTCTRPDLAYPLSLLARYVAPGRHRKVHRDAAKRVLCYLCSTSGMGLVLGGRGPVVFTGHADASWVDDSATQRSSQGYTFSLGSSSVSWRSTRSYSVLSCSCEAEIYAGAMAAQELRWLTYLLTDLGEQPRSPPVLYVDNKAMIALCQEHRLEHGTKHIALRYFLARELQQRGQLRLAYVATRANTADVFTKALPPGDHQRFVTVLDLLVLLFLTDSPLPAPSPYAEQTDSLTERREPESRPASPVSAVRTGRHIPRPRTRRLPDTHIMALCLSSVPLRVPLPSPPVSSLADSPDPESYLVRAVSPTVTRLLAIVVTDPSFESAAASALVAELVDFAVACRLDYAASLVAESESDCPPSVGGECDLGTDVLEDSQRQGVDFFHTFSPTPKMTSLRVLLHVAAQRGYELHSLDFSTVFLQGSLHEEIWLHRPPGFTGSFPASTQWSLWRRVYGLHQVPREWHDTLRTTLAALVFAPSTSDTSLFLRTDTSLLPFYILVYVDDLVFVTANTEALALVKSELQNRHTCTDLGELRSYLGLQITRDRARRNITLTQSHMVHQVLQRFGFLSSSPHSTFLPTGHSLSAPPSDESVEPSGPYPELVGCLMYVMNCTRPDLAYPLSSLARYVVPGRHRPEQWEAAKRVLRYLCSTSGIGLVLGGRGPIVLIGHADASWGYTFGLGSGSVSWRATRSSSVLGSSCEAEIYAGAMAAQELRWLTYLLTDLGEPPRSPPVLYVDNKAMLALCREQRLEHRTKHIALRYFLARELQQRGQLRLAFVASEANTADVFTKALAPCDHQRCCTQLGLVPVLPHLLTS
ncbi:unnamed protein product [Closterium sp. NIES-53]